MPDPIRISLADCERVLLEEIADRKSTRDDVASTYGLAILSSEKDRIDWAKVNNAIVARWSQSAMLYIKEQAWKRIKAKGGLQ